MSIYVYKRYLFISFDFEAYLVEVEEMFLEIVSTPGKLLLASRTFIIFKEDLFPRTYIKLHMIRICEII